MNKPNQRKDSESNTQVGHDFEIVAQSFFRKQNVNLILHYPLHIGIGNKKIHEFDLGDSIHKIIVECKSHRWTEGDNVPSAKITTWDQAMLFFYVAPLDYRKILFVLKDLSQKRQETLAEYYVRMHSHLIPPGVEVWEYDNTRELAYRIPINQ